MPSSIAASGLAAMATALSPASSYWGYSLNAYDPSAQAFINRITAAGGNFDYTSIGGGNEDAVKRAINDYVVACKAIGAWSSGIAQYLYIGQNAASHALNAIQDLNNMTWYGTITHDAYGFTPDGSTGYGLTGIQSNIVGSSDSTVISYVRTFSSSSKGWIGARTNTSPTYYGHFMDGYSGQFACSLGYSDVEKGKVTTSIAGCYIASRLSNTVRYNQNGTEIASFPVTTAGTTTGTIQVGGINYGPYQSNNFTQSLHSISSYGLGSSNMTLLRTAIQALQTALGRQV